MGGGIAICFANAGIPVTLIDATAAALERGLANVDRTYQSMVDRGRLDAADKAQRMALIRGRSTTTILRDADVIIEAVFESMDLKREIFASSTRSAKPGAVLATNTSTLDIEQIADATARPEDVIGMHFFSPANVMPLLEVVRTHEDLAATIRTVMDLAKPLRKTPVLAKVCYGFIGNRMMEGYAREAERMVLEGATPRQVDTALEEWGMAMGILAVFDMAGIDVGVNVHKANADAVPAGSRPTTRRTSRCTRPVGSGRRTARATTVTSRAIARASTIPKRSRSCAHVREQLGYRAARAHASRRSSNAASIRCSTKAFAFSRRALRCAPPTSTSSGPRAMVFRVIAAARCSMPRRSDCRRCSRACCKYQGHLRSDALGARTAARRTRRTTATALRSGKQTRRERSDERQTS